MLKWLQHLCTKLQANDDPFPSVAEIVGDLVAEFVAATQPCPALPPLDKMAANANYHWRRNRPQHPQDLAFEVELNIRHILDNCPSLCDRPTTRSSREGEDLVYRCNILCCLTAISATVNAFVQRDDCNKQLPLAICVMSRCRKRDYVVIFHELSAAATSLRMILDFENTTWRAARVVFPTVVLKGCAFLFMWAIWRCIQELWSFCQLEQEVTVALSPLLPYVARTWIKGATWPPT